MIISFPRISSGVIFMSAQRNKPEWLRQRVCNDEIYKNVRKMIEGLSLHTVCESANCPNIGECFGNKTATFLILGGVCTRACKYCAVTKGHPELLDAGEPKKLASAVAQLGLKHAVITSVTRDDLPDGGAKQFAECIDAVYKQCPDTTVEVLVPDFQGKTESLDIVLNRRPTVFNHNIETVKRLFPFIRPIGNYDQSLRILNYAHNYAYRPLVKSGIMVGLGETIDDMAETLKELFMAGTDIVTIGQYLRPSDKHVPVAEYVSLEKFREYKILGEKIGIPYVISGPLVRSSYKAGVAVNEYGKKYGSCGERKSS